MLQVFEKARVISRFFAYLCAGSLSNAKSACFRMYDPFIARWTTIDPLAEKYYSTSPYAYTGNNPIKRIDVGGKKWVDVNGNLMWKNNQWTKYATRDAMRVGNAMRATETGRAAFNRIANHSADISVTISPEDNSKTSTGTLVRGEAETRSSAMSDGSVQLNSASITIYEGSIKAEVNGSVNDNSYTGALIGVLPKEKAVDGAIGSVAVHEAAHLTPENVQQAYENVQAKDKDMPKPHDIEKEPTQEQNKYLEELLRMQ
jgi:hypothetical protein